MVKLQLQQVEFGVVEQEFLLQTILHLVQPIHLLPVEIANGTGFTLTLTTTGNGDCNAVTDQITITITPAPTADAGADSNFLCQQP